MTTAPLQSLSPNFVDSTMLTVVEPLADAAANVAATLVRAAVLGAGRLVLDGMSLVLTGAMSGDQVEPRVMRVSQVARA